MKDGDKGRVKEYKEAIAKNLEFIEDESDLEKLYKYSEILAKWDEVREKELYRALIIRKMLDDQESEKKIKEIYYFISAYMG